MTSSFFDDVNSLDCYTEYTFLFLDDDLISLIPWAIVTSLHHLHHCAEPPVYYYYLEFSGSFFLDEIFEKVSFDH